MGGPQMLQDVCTLPCHDGSSCDLQWDLTSTCVYLKKNCRMTVGVTGIGSGYRFAHRHHMDRFEAQCKEQLVLLACPGGH
jgi:hypothetical protein